MAVEKCGHPYYKMEKGELVCTECGANPRQPKIEDKEKKPEENKEKKPKKK